MEFDEAPCSTTCFDRFNVVVDPSIRLSATLFWHLKLLHESFEADHCYCAARNELDRCLKVENRSRSHQILENHIATGTIEYSWRPENQQSDDMVRKHHLTIYAVLQRPLSVSCVDTEVLYALALSGGGLNDNDRTRIDNWLGEQFCAEFRPCSRRLSWSATLQQDYCKSYQWTRDRHRVIQLLPRRF